MIKAETNLLPSNLHPWARRIRRHVLPPNCQNVDCIGSRIPFLWRTRAPIRLHDKWLCSSRCVQHEAQVIFEQILSSEDPSAHPAPRIPLGLLLYSQGRLDLAQLRAALQAQQGSPRRKLGEWLQMLHFASERDVLAGLAVQWAYRLLSVREAPIICPGLVPAPLSKTLRLVPLRWLPPARLLYIAVSDRVDYRVLSAIEQMLECRIEPCLVSETVMNRMLEQVSDFERVVRVFERVSGPSEMARITASYVARLETETLRLMRCGPYVWARLQNEGKPADLLFTRRNLAEFNRQPADLPAG